MSVRENIATNLVTSLQAISTPNVKKVTREPFDFDKLSNAQFPAILVRTANETREDASIGGSMSSDKASHERLLFGSETSLHDDVCKQVVECC